MRVIEPSVELMAYTPDMLKLIEHAGRTCYKSEEKITDESAEEFVRMVLKRGHHSVLEHGSVTVKFIADRGMTHELVRHRLVSYSQESTRFCSYSRDKFGSEIAVIKPPGMGATASITWVEACEKAEEKYMAMTRQGCKPQIARSVLPICLKTEIVTSANVREWRHILTRRTSGKAHPQIRKLMTDVWHIFHERWPVLVEDIEPYDVDKH